MSDNHFGKNDDLIDILNALDPKQLLKLMKEIGLVSVKKGGVKKGEALFKELGCIEI